MAKGITIKKGGETLYPKTVTSLVFDARTNRNLEDILQQSNSNQSSLSINTKKLLIKIMKSGKFKHTIKEDMRKLIAEFGLSSDEELSNLDEVDISNTEDEPPKKYSIKEGVNVSIKKSVQGDNPITIHLEKEESDTYLSDYRSTIWAVDNTSICKIQNLGANCKVTPLHDGSVNLYFIYYGKVLASTILYISGYGQGEGSNYEGTIIDNNTAPQPPTNEPKPIHPPTPPKPEPPQEPPYLALSHTTFAVSKESPTFDITADTHGKAKVDEIKWFISGGGNSTITPLDANRARVKVTDDGQIYVKAVYKGLEVSSYGVSSGFAPKQVIPTISLNPINARLSRSNSQVEIVAAVTPEPNGSDTIRWSVPNENTILISANGKTCRVIAKSNGTETITATYKGKEATATINVQGFNDIRFENANITAAGRNQVTNRLIVSPKNDEPNKQIQYTLEGDEFATMVVSNNIVTLTPKKNGRGKVIAKYDDITKAEFSFVVEGIQEEATNPSVNTSGKNLVTSKDKVVGYVNENGFHAVNAGYTSIALKLNEGQYAITNLPTNKLGGSTFIALVKSTKRSRRYEHNIAVPLDFGQGHDTMIFKSGDNTFTDRGIYKVTTDITKDNKLVFSVPKGSYNFKFYTLYIYCSKDGVDVFDEVIVEEVKQ